MVPNRWMCIPFVRSAQRMVTIDHNSKHILEGIYVLPWTWIPRQGPLKMYMSCAKVSVNFNTSLQQPELANGLPKLFMVNDDIGNKTIKNRNVIYPELGSNCNIGAASDVKMPYVHGSQILFKPQSYAQCTKGNVLSPVANLPSIGSSNYSTRTSTKTPRQLPQISPLSPAVCTTPAKHPTLDSLQTLL